VWFLIGWYSDTWHIPPKEENLNCTAQQMKDAAAYHFTTEAVMLSSDNKITISGMTGMQFRDRLENKLDVDPATVAGFPEAPLAYDAVWAMALAFNCTMAKLVASGMKLERFSYKNDFMYKQLFNCMKETRFTGVSVRYLRCCEVNINSSRIFRAKLCSPIWVIESPEHESNNFKVFS
jgi:gamma-aminobutyric acid type B receptor